MRKEIKNFTHLMETKMLLNEHKGGHERLKLDELMKLLHQEIRELKGAIDAKDYKATALECADVANYAMLIADKCIKRSLV